MNTLLTPNDIQLIRGLLKSQKAGFVLLIYLTLISGAIFVTSLSAMMISRASQSPLFIMMVLASAIMAFFLARAARNAWQQIIQPLRAAVRHGGEKVMKVGALDTVSLAGKGRVVYGIGGNPVVTYPLLVDNGLALLQEPITTVETLLNHRVYLHLFVMPDGRHLLLEMEYPDLKRDNNTPVHRISSQAKVASGVFRYVLYTFGYLVSLFIVVFVVPIGIIFGIVPLTIGYIILLLREQKRGRAHKKTPVPQGINGVVTEIIKAKSRIQVMGEPSSNTNDTWFRVDGKAYLIRSNKPLPPVAVGDFIELVVN